MSAIITNAPTSGFPAALGGSEFGLPTGAELGPRLPGANDSISPLAQNAFSAPGDPGLRYGDSSGANQSSGLAGFNAIMNGFVSALQNVMAGLAQQFGFASTPAQSATPSETMYANATANSTGDPHESFDGTTSAGTSDAQHWNSMAAHADLLDSDSFAGGYRVATTVTAPDSKGVTLNASASVVLDGGATNVSYNGNGSYAVSSDGQSVSLQRGQTVSLGNGESVTLGTDDSLSVADTNGSGGSLITKFASNRSGGVDVSTKASNVDLGGYLVTQSDTPTLPAPPHRYTDLPDQAPITYAYSSFDASALD